nr:MAG TPA: hypothetical protein [Caudoviricetes sp.]
MRTAATIPLRTSYIPNMRMVRRDACYRQMWDT